ncbi:hypothetical protein BpHYR1_002963 [Brachionus plicatilis]|uniref:Uncharacterized protein n=1 Tax=Brachionus plicatilis TaxID=10195 RepID=A0A3M7PX25_BRAPC|nr:hypothetical protein BpHYR1_002963 [Brachionus plicatilis]
MEQSQQVNESVPSHPEPECLIYLSQFALRSLDQCKSELTSFYVSRLDQFARIPQNDLTECFKQLQIEIIKHLRKELSFQLLAHHSLQGSFMLRSISSLNSLSKDIYAITHLSLNNNVSETDFLVVYKKTQNTHPLDEDDLNDIYTEIEDVHLDVKRTKNQMKSLIEMVKIQSSQIENLLNENKTLKSVFETNNLILKQIQTTLSNLPSDFPNLPLISSQSTSDKNTTQQVYHSFAHAINSNSSKTNNTPRSQKRSAPHDLASETNSNQNGNKTQKTHHTPTLAINNSCSSAFPIRPNTQPFNQKSVRSFDSSLPDSSSKPKENSRENHVFDLEKIKDKNNWPRGAVINRYHKPFALRQR